MPKREFQNGFTQRREKGDGGNNVSLFPFVVFKFPIIGGYYLIKYLLVQQPHSYTLNFFIHFPRPKYIPCYLNQFLNSEGKLRMTGIPENLTLNPNPNIHLNLSHARYYT